jgi:hypothetical protein
MNYHMENLQFAGQLTPLDSIRSIIWLPVGKRLGL